MAQAQGPASSATPPTLAQGSLQDAPAHIGHHLSGSCSHSAVCMIPQCAPSSHGYLCCLPHRALQQDRAAQHAPAQAPPPRASGPGPSYHGPAAPHAAGLAGPSAAAAAAAAAGPHPEGSGDLADGDAGSDDEGAGSGELGSSLLPNPMRDGVAPGITQVITSVPQVGGCQAGHHLGCDSATCAAQPVSPVCLHSSRVRTVKVTHITPRSILSPWAGLTWHRHHCDGIHKILAHFRLTDMPTCLPACLCCPQEILKLVKKIPAGVQSSCKRHWQAQRSVDVTCGSLTGRFHMDPNGVCYVTYEVRCGCAVVLY